MEWINTDIEVRYQETDQMGVVYHANYLVWFEIGRTKYIEHLGFKYAEMEERGVVSPVTDVQVSYKRPIRYGQKVTVKTKLANYDGIRTVYNYQISDHTGEIAVSGETKHVVVSKERFKPLIIRKVYPEWHEAFKNKVSERK